MLAFGKTTRFALVVAALGSAGCARHEEPYVAQGSLKDSAPAAPVEPKSRATWPPAQRVAARPIAAPAAEPDGNGAAPRTAGGGEVQPAPGADRGARSSPSNPVRNPVRNPATASGAPLAIAPATAQPDAGADPAAPLAPSAAEQQSATFARLLAQGRQLFEAGKVLEARKRFIAALNGLSPAATLALARTFDTFYLSKLSAPDGAPDMQRALQLYQSALERGSADAKPDLDRTRATLGLPPL